MAQHGCEQQRVVSFGDGNESAADHREDFRDRAQREVESRELVLECDHRQAERDQVRVEVRDRLVATGGLEQGLAAELTGEHLVEGCGDRLPVHRALGNARHVTSPRSCRATTLRWISLVPL